MREFCGTNWHTEAASAKPSISVDIIFISIKRCQSLSSFVICAEAFEIQPKLAVQIPAESVFYLVTVFVRAQLPQRDLGLHPADGALLVRKAVGLSGDVDGDVRRVRQQLVQVLLLAGAHPLQRSAVGVVTGVSLLAVRHRQVL